MDQIVIDCGVPDKAAVGVGDEVVLLGRQGDQEITADEWAGRLDTISYEVLCGIGPRVPGIPSDRLPVSGRMRMLRCPGLFSFFGTADFVSFPTTVSLS